MLSNVRTCPRCGINATDRDYCDECEQATTAARPRRKTRT